MQVQVRIRKNFKTLIPDKWGGAIWALMFVASLVRNVVSVIDLFTGLSGAAEITIAVIEAVLGYGVLPAVVCYLFSLILVTMSARRGCVFCRRNDFVYICMLFTSAAYFVMGIIECFCFLDAAVLPYTTMLLNMTVLTGTYCAMYFVVFRRMMDPKQQYVNFSAWASVYLFLQGLMTAFSAVSYIILFYDSSVSEMVMDILETYYGAPVTIDEGWAIASIIALCLLAAWVIAAIAVSAVLGKKAKNYVPPAPERSPFDQGGGNGGNDGGSPFEEFGGAPDGQVADKDDKVFEEFDL